MNRGRLLGSPIFYFRSDVRGQEVRDQKSEVRGQGCGLLDAVAICDRTLNPQVHLEPIVILVGSDPGPKEGITLDEMSDGTVVVPYAYRPLSGFYRLEPQ